MEITTHINLGDLAEFRVYQRLHGRAGQLKRLAFAILSPLVLLAAPLVMFRNSPDAWQLAKRSLPFLLILPCFWWLLYILTRQRLRKQITAELKTDQSQSPVGEFHITLAPDGVSVSRPSEPQNFISWEKIPRVLANGDYGYIYTSSDSAIILPQKCFADDGYFRAFVRMAVVYQWEKESASTSLAQQPAPPAPVTNNASVTPQSNSPSMIAFRPELRP